MPYGNTMNVLKKVFLREEAAEKARGEARPTWENESSGSL